MKKLFFRWQLPLLVMALIMAGLLPTQAAQPQTETFRVAGSAKIVVGTNRFASLLDLHVGDHVHLAYDHENGTVVGLHAWDGVPQKNPAPKSNSASSVHHNKAASGLAHLHGIIQSVDAPLGMVTIEFEGHYLL